MDKHHPAVVGDTFASLLSRSKALPVYLPELERYLLEYPEAKSEDIQSEFYWEKVNFGLKPTLRIVQAIVYRGPRSYGPGLCRCCEATLREPLLRDGSGFDRLRARPGESRPRLLFDHSQGFAAGRLTVLKAES